MIKVSIVIPCYNSQNHIEKLVKNIINTFNDSEYLLQEIILVNDNSSDDTLKIIKKLQLSNNKIIINNNPVNLGQEKTTLIGIQISTGDYIVTMDDDYKSSIRSFKTFRYMYQRRFRLGLLWQ